MSGHEAAASSEQHGETPHEDSLVNVIARLVNFGVLAGTLVYLLRSPLAGYLANRGAQIRGDLVNAAEMKTSRFTVLMPPPPTYPQISGPFCTNHAWPGSIAPIGSSLTNGTPNTSCISIAAFVLDEL